MVEKLNIHPSWENILYPLLTTVTAEMLLQKLGDNYHPDKKSIFKAFSIPKDSVKIVIVGQDVYPDASLATGIAFGVPPGKDSPSLRMIRKECHREYTDDLTSSLFLCSPEEVDELFDNTMQHWVDQGCLMLNSALTCNSKPGDQWDIWQPFMSLLFRALDKELDVPFIFLGKKAQTLGKLIDENPSLNYPHPNADTYGKPAFVGCGIFGQLDMVLTEQIQWVKKPLNTTQPPLMQGLPF